MFDGNCDDNINSFGVKGEAVSDSSFASLFGGPFDISKVCGTGK